MKVLFCVDQAAEEKAILLGGWIAKRLGAHMDFWLILETQDEMSASEPLLEREREILRQVAPDVRAVMKKGLAAEILGRLDEDDYDLVILRFKGRRGLKKIFPRPEIINIVKHAKVPILAVWGKKDSIKRLLICHGGSPYADQAGDFAAKIAKALGAKATLLHVSETFPEIYAEEKGGRGTLEEFRKRYPLMAESLTQAVDRLRTAGLETDLRIRHGLVAERIVQEVEDGGYDLVVMSSHGMAGVRHLILGSNTEEVLRHVGIPILVVRAKEEHPILDRIVG
jgi:nucleotide-binding universal stress UspA family protein